MEVAAQRKRKRRGADLRLLDITEGRERHPRLAIPLLRHILRRAHPFRPDAFTFPPLIRAAPAHASAAQLHTCATPTSEIQLKSPNWLFDQRKHAETVPTAKVIPVENANEGNKDETNVSLRGELNWVSSSADSCEEDNFRRYLAFTKADVDNGWYSAALLYDQDENSGAYKHYSEFCQGPVMDPFEHDPEKEGHYREALCANDAEE
ncbi:phosphatidylinositol-3-phosphatase SAC1-like [Hordeum vulgare subsp. vulgare]|uniref:phosphatidylinositol-3-phosphatase SAC1-like n=1 Tax=Hordeum vulgare subsp. vulgare TaxID=112509 RepID=UPI001D1A57D3|nr:phosphatidylinositol-3-phosphatase SAC1-like [Hordeum vulgare subsp. vulgare]